MHTVLAAHGGIFPAARTRSPRRLSLREREKISRDLAAGESLRQIAAKLKRPPSIIGREIERNGCKGSGFTSFSLYFDCLQNGE